jgi:hypothetical protein
LPSATMGPKVKQHRTSDTLYSHQHISVDTMASQMILSANLKTLRLTGLRPTPNTKTKLLNFTTPKVKLKIRIYHENLVCLSQAMMVGRISELTSGI